MPSVSEKQRKFMGAELARKREGKKTKTDMSEKQLEDFASKALLSRLDDYLTKMNGVRNPTPQEEREHVKRKYTNRYPTGQGEIVNTKATRSNPYRGTSSDPNIDEEDPMEKSLMKAFVDENKGKARYKQLKSMPKQALLETFSRYNKVHSADKNTPKGDLIAGILEDEGLIKGNDRKGQMYNVLRRINHYIDTHATNPVTRDRDYETSVNPKSSGKNPIADLQVAQQQYEKRKQQAKVGRHPSEEFQRKRKLNKAISDYIDKNS